jgi:hydroxyacyl-ACP dehydratase HTD2-like protein with hotdog domain
VTAELHLRHLGLAELATSEISAEHTGRIGATLNAADTPSTGEPLPLLWHWGHFAPIAPTRDLGRDGHPELPAGPLDAYPRRMWASGVVEAPGHLIVGEPASRASRVIDTKESHGRSGDLFIVRLEHRYRQFDLDQIVERQTFVYRTPGPNAPLPAGDYRPQLGPREWADRHVPDSKLLFRFSAVTFNSHRIHYDHDYATGVEGYPGLVVHGPLTATLVGESLRQHLGRPLSRFEFRASAPLFVDQPFTIVGTTDPELGAHVMRNDGTESMTVMAE